MGSIEEVTIDPLSCERFESIQGAGAYRRFVETMQLAAGVLEGNTFWNVNSTAEGGGVAEMLAALLPYARDAGLDARWVTIEGNEDFFEVTKRIHNRLHGAGGDGGDLDAGEKEIYDATLAPSAAALCELVSPGDVALVHDPQTAGLIPALREAGAYVVWQCHVGIDEPNNLARGAWDFLRPAVRAAHRHVFTRSSYLWDGLEKEKLVVIAPSIDAFALKNQPMDEATVKAILGAAGIVDEEIGSSPEITTADGRRHVVADQVEVHAGVAPPQPDRPLVVQISRWDRLKDPLGVIDFFVRHVAPETDAHLLVGGPAVDEVADDPEAKEVFEECAGMCDRLDASLRDRVHLLWMPMDDALVNAIQRRAGVVVQKSFQEGFGLTVAEAMWKSKPPVASRVGGIQDQIVHGESGVLVDDPRDGEAFGEGVKALLEDHRSASRMGERARERVQEEFLAPRQLRQYGELITDLAG